MSNETLVKATLTRMDTLDTMAVLWNPAGYRIERRSELGAPSVLGRRTAGDYLVAGGEERFRTRLFLDTTESPSGKERDARYQAQTLASWMEPPSGEIRAPRVAFVWGPFRFQGAIESLDEDWIRFDPDGTPVRAWLDLVLRN